MDPLAIGLFISMAFVLILAIGQAITSPNGRGVAEMLSLMGIAVFLFCLGVVAVQAGRTHAEEFRLRSGTIEIGSSSTEVEVPAGARFKIVAVAIFARDVVVPMDWDSRPDVESAGPQSATRSNRITGTAAPGMEVFGPTTIQFRATSDAAADVVAMVAYEIEQER